MGKLKELLVVLMCDIMGYRTKRCNCDDPNPRVYRCVYGNCEIIRCDNCHNTIRVFASKCFYPYSPDSGEPLFDFV